MREVDREEEFLTNTLQKKLDELRKEKVELETRLEIEQEYIVNKLRKQIASVTNEKNELESKLALNSSELIEKLFDSVQRLQSNEVADSAPAMFAELSAQIKALHEAQVQYRRDHQACEKANRELKEQLKRNENENFVLGQKVLQQQERAKQLSQQNASLQADWEIQQERQVNAAGRCLRNSSLSSSSSSAAAARPICGVPALARDLSTRSLTSSSSSPRTADLRTGPLSGRQQATKATEATEETEEENQQEQPQK